MWVPLAVFSPPPPTEHDQGEGSPSTLADSILQKVVIFQHHIKSCTIWHQFASKHRNLNKISQKGIGHPSPKTPPLDDLKS